MMNRILFLIAIILCFASKSHAQNKDTTYNSKVATLDATVNTLYTVISGKKGEERDWKLFKFLFKPDAKLIPSWKNKEGNASVQYLTPEEYIQSSGKWLTENGFFEKEIFRTSNTFGNISQVFSTFESYHSMEESTPFMRGINSIQLLKDSNRWWIINVYWTQENENNPIPVNYLPK